VINLKKKLGLSTIPKKYYDSVATEYDNDYGNIYTETSALAYEQITKHLQTENPKVLDIAAGTGNILAKLQQKYPNAAFTANDASKNMLAITKEKIGNQNTFINDCLKNIGDNIEPNSQDLILAHYVMCFVDSEWSILKSLEMLKPGGFLSIITTTKCNLHELRTKYFVKTSQILGANSSIEKAYIPSSIEHLTNDIIPDTASIQSALLYNKEISFANDVDIRSYLIDSGWAASYMNNGFKFKQALINFISSSMYRANKSKFPISATSDVAIVLVQKPS
jgi:ubiquinone/menaquinone biosynthesis C-methylase UbiE